MEMRRNRYGDREMRKYGDEKREMWIFDSSIRIDFTVLLFYFNKKIEWDGNESRFEYRFLNVVKVFM
jgi:hypothetical protein